MKVLIVLLGSFGLVMALMKLFAGTFNLRKAACAAMSAMLFFTASGHFVYTKGMTMMLPGFLPLKTQLVYFTGIIEIAAAISLHIAKLRRLTGWLLIIFFVLILPANIMASVYHVDIYKANFHGEGVTYLWFRIPLQIFLIIWVYVLIVKGWKLGTADQNKQHHE